MKVTRLIREYVTKTISEAYDKKKNPYEDLLEAENKKLNQFNAKLDEKIKKEATKFFGENKYFYMNCGKGNLPYEGKEYKCYQVYRPHSKYEYLSADWEKERAAEKKEKIDNVILNLELGANRAELDAMLRSIVEGIK